jgi:dTDP-4-amino-4,6-dideoxygalactose transaminase
MGIPFVDLKAQYKTIKSEIDQAVSEVIESTAFVGGERLERFEKNFARYTGSKHAVGASSGTSALHLALHVLGIGRGDEVITATNTFIATTEAISQTGAAPVLVDVDDETLTLDPNKVEAAVTPRTKAIIPVHLYGQCADMDAIRAIARRHSLKVIVDACQAHGAMLGGKREAILGDVTCYSFYPGKNLGAYGDGGAVVTDDGDLAEKMRSVGNHGRLDRYTHSAEGFNYRLDALQAAILDVKLGHLDEWNERRRSRAKLYDAAFANGPVRPVREGAGRYHVYHLYVVRTRARDVLLEGLAKRGVSAGIHYPVPLHLQVAYKRMGLGVGSYPVAEKAAVEIVSLPMYPELSDEMVGEVVRATKDILG